MLNTKWPVCQRTELQNHHQNIAESGYWHKCITDDWLDCDRFEWLGISACFSCLVHAWSCIRHCVFWLVINLKCFLAHSSAVVSCLTHHLLMSYWWWWLSSHACSQSTHWQSKAKNECGLYQLFKFALAKSWQETSPCDGNWSTAFH